MLITEIPQFLHEAGWTAGGRKVACTQPRRVAAASVAARVADEMHCKVGGTVGYRVRFEDMTTEGHTRIMFVTDGMLLRETLRDPLLTQYSVIMLDEAHERNANTDLLLALLKRILPKRPDLRVVVASATLQAEQFAAFFSSSDSAPTVPAIGASVEGLPATASAAGGGRKSRWGPSTAASSTVAAAPSTRSATDAAVHHGRAVVMQVPGRVHPVDVQYLQAPCSDFTTATVQSVLDIHKYEGPGDILVFLPTSESIESVVEQLREQAHGPAHNTAAARMAAEHRNLLSGKHGAVLQVQPLYAALSPAAQMAALAPAASPDGAGRPVRKCVVATNIAETSVTIDGVVFVVDAGFVNLPVFNPLTGLDAHIIQPTSRAAADQRAGRAGRTRPGKCFRLYTQQAHASMAVASIPDVLRVRLEGFVLQLKALGVRNVARFPLLTRPFPLTLMRALENLQALGALSRPAGELTRPMGEFLAEFPAAPEVAALLLWSLPMGCAEEAVTIAAVLGVKSIYAHGTAAAQRATAEMPALAAVEGDLLSYVNVYKAWEEEGFAKEFAVQRGLQFLTLRRVRQVRAQLRRYVSRLLAAARQRWDEAGRPDDTQGGAGGAVQRERQDTVAPAAANASSEEEQAMWPSSISLSALAQAQVASCEEDTEVLQRCICRAFFASSAQRQRDGTYLTLKDSRTVRVHPRSVLHRFGLAPQWVVFTEALLTDDEYILHCSAVQQAWLMRSAPHFFKLVDRAGAGKWASQAHVSERDLTRAAATDSKAMPGQRREVDVHDDAALREQYLALAAPDAGSKSTALAKYTSQQDMVVYGAAGGGVRSDAGGLSSAARDSLRAVDAMWASGDATSAVQETSRGLNATSAMPSGTGAASLLIGARGGAAALQSGPTYVPQRPAKRPRQGKGKQSKSKRATGLASVLAHLRSDLQDEGADDF